MTPRKQTPQLDNELLIASWHTEMPASELARAFGISADALKQRWRSLVELGSLPDEPRPINRQGLMRAADSEPVRVSNDKNEQFLELLRKHHSGRDPTK
jgi:transposase-like protein